jgi:hypothetical protein
VNEQQEYAALLHSLPKALSAEELARFKTDYPIENGRQMIVKPTAVCREGSWYGVILLIHRLGVVGHQVFPQGRQFREDARYIAEQFCERVQDYHQHMTGVRNRGVIDMDDDDPILPCPPLEPRP